MPLLRRRVCLVLVTSLLALAAACRGDDEGAAGRATTTLATTTTTLPPQALLTGLPVTDPAKLNRPAVSVKIDNNAAARPQAGLGAADVVYEEVTEGITRFVVVFQSTDAGSIGPVRSVRPADPLIVAPFHGPLVFSGGAPAIVQLVRNAGVPFVDENDTDVLYRIPGRTAPHNLYTETGLIYQRVDGSTPPPPAFAPFLPPGQEWAPPGGVPVTGMDVPLADVTASYSWDAAAGGWRRATDGVAHGLDDGAQWTPNTVIVQFTPYSRFAADQAVTFPEVIGSGEAWFFADGTLAKGTWTKAGATAMTTYADATGAPMVLPPGRIVVELAEPGAAVSFDSPPEPSTTAVATTGT